MRNGGSLVVLLALVAIACDSAQPASVLGPTPLTLTPPAASPVSHPRLADANPIAIGETVWSQTTTDDRLCDPHWPHRCRYFKVTAPRDTMLRVTMRWSPAQPDPYPLDIAVIGPDGREWPAVVGHGTHRYVDVPALAGATYLIEVWSFLTPAEPFELTSSIEPR